MKKRNIIFLLSVLLLSSILMATSCKDDEDNTLTATAENPIYRKKFMELEGYIGMDEEVFKAKMRDSLGLEEIPFVTVSGDKLSFYECPPPKVYVYWVYTNVYTNKINSVGFFLGLMISTP